MKYHFKVHKEGKGYWAKCLELEGCITQGKSIDELKTNMAEALNLYLDEPGESNMVFPFPKKITGKDIAEVAVDPEIAFAVYLRNLRIKHHLSQNQIAKMLNMKNVYSYQRLEKKANPTLSTLMKIKELFPEFSVDLILKRI